MNLFTILAPAFYPDKWYVRYLHDSAKRWDVPVRFYGFGEPYRDWFDVQITRLIEEIKTVETSHLIYTDASDAILLCAMEEIEVKYEDLDSPPLLLSLEQDGVCGGGWLAEKDEALYWLEVLRSQDNPSTNPQLRWRREVDEGEIDADYIDTDSLIFQVTGPELRVLDVDGTPRIYNPATKNYPAILHFAGGYTDRDVGKAALIEPLWRELGYESALFV